MSEPLQNNDHPREVLSSPTLYRLSQHRLRKQDIFLLSFVNIDSAWLTHSQCIILYNIVLINSIPDYFIEVKTVSFRGEQTDNSVCFESTIS